MCIQSAHFQNIWMECLNQLLDICDSIIFFLSLDRFPLSCTLEYSHTYFSAPGPPGVQPIRNVFYCIQHRCFMFSYFPYINMKAGKIVALSLLPIAMFRKPMDFVLRRPQQFRLISIFSPSSFQLQAGFSAPNRLYIHRKSMNQKPKLNNDLVEIQLNFSNFMLFLCIFSFFSLQFPEVRSRCDYFSLWPNYTKIHDDWKVFAEH